MTIRSLRPLRALALAAALLGGTFLAAPAAEAGGVQVDVRFAGNGQRDRHDRYDRDRDHRNNRYNRNDRRGGYGYGPGGPGYYRPRPRPYYAPERVWVRGHYDRYGYWVPGHYVFVNRY